MRRRRLGSELRRLRVIAGMTGDQVIASIGWASASKLSRLENGKSRADLGDVLDLLDLYQVAGPERDKVVTIAREASNTRGWLREYEAMTQRQRFYAELESDSADIREFSPAVVPGLLQTPGYARTRILSSKALLAPEGDRGFDADAEVKARVARQKILNREANPPRYEAVLDEAVLAGRGGRGEVMRDQLAHLATLGQLPNVTLYVLLREAVVGEYYLPHTAFSLYRFADPDIPETVAVEALANDVVLQEKSDIARYTMVFDWLRDAALPPDQSLSWLCDASHVIGTVNGRSAPRPRQSERIAKRSTDASSA